MSKRFPRQEQAERLAAVQERLAQGQSQPRVAEEVAIARSTVQDWLGEAAEPCGSGGIASLLRPRGGCCLVASAGSGGPSGHHGADRSRHSSGVYFPGAERVVGVRGQFLRQPTEA
ncbi:MAG: helix-turn-helix domain-containing protein [Hahellaceae bacterium]|nr:helix-turn-helix domain-containing protein [Hahellaceae bacterium]